MVVVGRIQGPYGIKGWVHVASFTDPKENIQSYSPWQLGSQSDGNDWRAAAVESIRPHKQGYVAKLSGIDDRNGAEAVKGLLIGVADAVLPAPAVDEYYWRDLVGAEVINSDGRSLGRVASLIETGAHDVLVVGPSDPSKDDWTDESSDKSSDKSADKGAGEILIPFHASYVQGVDTDAGRIQVDWPVAELD